MKNIHTIRLKASNAFRRIHVRTAFLSWIVSIATVGIFSISVIPQQRQVYLDALDSKAQLLATSIRDVAASSVVTEDYSEVVDHCMEIVQENETISFLILTRNDGFSLIHRQDGWRIDQLNGPWQTGLHGQDVYSEIRYNELTGEETFQYSCRFSYSGMNWGWVHIGLSLDQYKAGLNAIIRRTAVVALFCIAFGLLVSLLYAGKLVRPILALQSYVKKVTDGNLDVRANITSGDEVESLAQSFNEMTAEICRAQEELVAAKEGAEAASTAKSRFLATMSHEIRTPLNGVVGMLKLLRESPLDNKQRRFVKKGILSSEALLAVINDILDFSKIEAGKMDLECVPFNVIDITENVVQMFAQRAEEKGIELVCSIHQQVPRMALGDPNRLGQILINLVGNAVKFTEHGDVVVQVNPVDGDDRQVQIQFEVRDTGIGISLEEKERIFEPFLQEDSSTTRQFGGTGLGLGICRQLVELMGGTIEIDSIHGEGSTFRFTIQLGVVPAKVQPRTLNGISGTHALVVDDHDITLEIISHTLSCWGSTAQTATDGEAALKLIRHQVDFGLPYDFVIIDWNMPGMNGEELCRQIQADPALAGTPLILLSSVVGIHNAIFEDLGLSAWVAKPARQSELHDAIMQAVNPSAPSALEVAPDDVPAIPPHAGNVRILLAEDNEINQEVATEILKQFGYRCDIAANGREALDALAAHSYDLVFMDCMMPEMDGYAATQAIRKTELQTGQHVPIVALTANAMKGDREQCIAAGMDDYLSKPLDPDEVNRIILKWSTQPPVEEEIPDSDRSSDLDAHTQRLMFDYDEALRRCMGNTTLLEKLTSRFLIQLVEEMRALGKALSDSDAQAVVQVAHRIKGSAANLAMETISSTAAQVEKYGRIHELNKAAEGFRDLSAETIQLRTFLQSARDRNIMADREDP